MLVGLFAIMSAPKLATTAVIGSNENQEYHLVDSMIGMCPALEWIQLEPPTLYLKRFGHVSFRFGWLTSSWCPFERPTQKISCLKDGEAPKSSVSLRPGSQPIQSLSPFLGFGRFGTH